MKSIYTHTYTYQLPICFPCMFQHDTSQDVAGSVPQGMVKETSDITSSSTNSRRELRAKLKAYLEKKATRVKSKKYVT